MEARKVMKIRNSFFFNIPSSMAEELKLKKGDVLWIEKASRDGLILSKFKDSSKLFAGVASIERIKAVGEEVYGEVRRKLRSLENTAINNVMQRLLCEVAKAEPGLRKGMVNKKKVRKP